MVKNLERTELPLHPGLNQEILVHLLADFDWPNHGAHQHSLMHLGGVKFPCNRYTLHSILHQSSNLFENEILKEPVGGVVPEVCKNVWLSFCQLLGHQVSQVL